MKKTLLVLLLCAVAALCSACGMDDVKNEIQSQGRDYGQVYELNDGDTMSTAFFDMNVNSAELVESVDGYIPDEEGNCFLVVNITVKNTFDKDIPMFDSDFELSYNGADETGTIMPESEFAADQLDAEYELAVGDSATGNLIYVVPADASDFRLYYYDLWNDDFEGDSFWLAFSATADAAV